MKICTACNESFQDEFNFCEVCGAKLHKHHDPSAPPAKRDWSLLGIALVLGAVVITVASIIFTPKARLTDNHTKESVAVATPPQTSPNAGTSSSATTPDTSVTSTDSTETGEEAAAKDAEAEAKKKEKEKAAKAAKEAAAKEAEAKAATSDSDVNPKAAKAAVQPTEPVHPKTEPKLEPVAVEPKLKEPESRPRTTVVQPEPKEAKKPAEDPKAATKPDDKKKDDKKKKGGGFFGVFKKIFGKDN